jgi:hypothetical protein
MANVALYEALVFLPDGGLDLVSYSHDQLALELGLHPCSGDCGSSCSVFFFLMDELLHLALLEQLLHPTWAAKLDPGCPHR